MARLALRHDRESGAALVDVLLAAIICVLMTTMAVPLGRSAGDTSRVRSAAGFLAGRLRAARQQALSANRSTAVVFDRVATGWSLRVCADGNADGVRRADLAEGRDHCGSLSHRFEELLTGVSLELRADVPTVDGDAGGGTGLRFGRAEMVSCSPLGHCSPGTLYLQSGSNQWAIRVAGVTGRTRLLRFDFGTRQWVTA